MDEPVEIITVDADNVDRHGFFCYMSKRKDFDKLAPLSP